MNKKFDNLISSIDDKTKELSKLKAELRKSAPKYFHELFEEWQSTKSHSKRMDKLHSINVTGEHEFNDGDATYLSWRITFDFEDEAISYAYEELDVESGELLSKKDSKYLKDIAASIGKIIDILEPQYVDINFNFESNSVVVNI